MRVLVTIPHVFNPQGGGGYASLSPDPQPRIQGLSQCLQALHEVYDSRSQFYFQYTHQLHTLSANHHSCAQLSIVICTTHGLHLLDKIPVDPQLYRHRETLCHPMFLGFECHQVLKEHLGEYDYYCYLEDDIILRDAAFFNKLRWFNAQIGDRAVLQPNRYERIRNRRGAQKFYIDPELEFKTGKRDNFAHYFNDNLVLTGRVMGDTVTIKRAENPHSGCFFLNRPQMQFWAQQPYFLDRDARFFGPLESAATLGLARTFRVYKPAPQNANFLEVQHFGDGWSRKIKNVKFW
jgi:hypothetical protein